MISVTLCKDSQFWSILFIFLRAMITLKSMILCANIIGTILEIGKSYFLLTLCWSGHVLGSIKGHVTLDFGSV